MVQVELTSDTWHFGKISFDKVIFKLDLVNNIRRFLLYVTYSSTSIKVQFIMACELILEAGKYLHLLTSVLCIDC